MTNRQLRGGGNAISGRKALAISALSGLTAVFLVRKLIIPERPQLFSLGDFFRPDVVSNIAYMLPQGTEDEFIADAWEWVGREIPYENIGSDMLFISNDEISCLKCFLGYQALERAQGNCVSKSSLLASVLLNRLPPSRVRIMIGMVGSNGVPIGGHAWVEVKRQNGLWYLLEATRPPQGVWVRPEQVKMDYVPSVVMSPDDIVCSDPELCTPNFCVPIPAFNASAFCGCSSNYPKLPIKIQRKI